MKKQFALLIMGILFSSCSHRATLTEASPTPMQKPLIGSGWISAPGRVEPISEEIEIGASLDGIVKKILIEEGEHVRKGEVVAILDNDDYKAQVLLAKAHLEESEAELRKVLNGARIEERREESAKVSEARTIMDNALSMMKRRINLYHDGFISEEEKEQAISVYKEAKARYELASQSRALVNSRAREEDIDKANAEVAAAQSQYAQAESFYQKTFVRSPINGLILRKHLRSGEAFSLSRETYIATIGDDSVLRVRSEIDENDIAALHVGEVAYVTAPSFKKQFWGKVVRVGKLFGRKNIHTDQPSEHVDTKILEALIQLNDGHLLPIGARVDTFIKVEN